MKLPFILIKLCAIAYLLTGCAAMQYQPDTVRVSIPISVSCIDGIPTAPQLHTNSILSTEDEYSFISDIHSDRLALIAYVEKLLAVLQACK